MRVMQQHVTPPPRRRMIVGISGATGIIFGLRILEELRRLDIETRLVMSKPGERTLACETDRKVRDVRAMADFSYSDADIGAAIASGSFRAMGMIVAPCSVRSLSAIATGNTDGLLTRAADVCLKERRRVVLMFRETPLHAGHIRTMAQATQNGAIVFRPCPPSTTDPPLSPTWWTTPSGTCSICTTSTQACSTDGPAGRKQLRTARAPGEARDAAHRPAPLYRGSARPRGNPGRRCAGLPRSGARRHHPPLHRDRGAGAPVQDLIRPPWRRIPHPWCSGRHERSAWHGARPRRRGAGAAADDRWPCDCGGHRREP